MVEVVILFCRFGVERNGFAWYVLVGLDDVVVEVLASTVVHVSDGREGRHDCSYYIY